MTPNLSSDLRQLPGYTSSRLAFYGMAEQALAGVQFNKEAAEALVVRIDGLMKQIEEEVEPKLPPRKLKKSEESLYSLPAKPFKKDGTLSSHMLAFIAKHEGCSWDGEAGVVWLDGKTYPITGKLQLPATLPMKLGNQDDLKDWLIEEHKWKPSLWNYKKDARGKPVRDDRGKLIQTSPKMQENKKLCPNLEALQGPLVAQVVLWLSLRNRKSVVEGWLENERLAYDGKLSAGAVGFTNTFRWKHTEVVNVPKAEDGVTLGKEMRSLFIARPGRKLAGYDAAGLENRVEAHFVYRYPGGPEAAQEILNGDPHYKNAFVFYPAELAKLGLKFGEVSKDDPQFKPFRSRSKNGRYALAFGCSARKLATTLQLPESQGDDLYEAFWNANLPLKHFRDNLTKFWETTGEKKWIRGIDGRRVHTRSQHSLVNTAIQSTGAILMEIANLFMEKALGGWAVDDEGYPCFRYKGHIVYRVLFVHDEVQYDAPDEIAVEVARLGSDSIRKAGEYLKMNVPFEGGFDPEHPEKSVDTSWAGTH